VTPPEAPNLRQLTSLITAVIVICALDLGREVLVPITLAVMGSIGTLIRAQVGQLGA
jgi:hypothetical protein